MCTAPSVAVIIERVAPDDVAEVKVEILVVKFGDAVIAFVAVTYEKVVGLTT